MTPKKVLTLFVIGMTLSTPAFAKSFFEQLLEGGNSNQSGNGYQQYEGNRQSLREDQARLDEAYSQLRQKQAAGQDTSAEQAQIQNLEQTYRNRREQVREQEWQMERAQRRQQMNYDRQRYSNPNNNYSNNGYQQNNGYQNQGGNSFFNNSNDPYGNQSGFQDDDNDGFRVRFGG